MLCNPLLGRLLGVTGITGGSVFFALLRLPYVS